MPDRTISYDEWAIDNGLSFQTFINFTVSAAGTSSYIYLKTPATKSIKITSMYQSMGGIVTVTLSRGATVSAVGTAPVISCLRDGANTSALTIGISPTVTSEGTSGQPFKILAGSTGATGLPSTIGTNLHRLLQPDTVYLIKLVTDTNNTYIQVGYEWIEA